MRGVFIQFPIRLHDVVCMHVGDFACTLASGSVRTAERLKNVSTSLNFLKHLSYQVSKREAC
jgi:hypothetical protein